MWGIVITGNFDKYGTQQWEPETKDIVFFVFMKRNPLLWKTLELSGVCSVASWY